MRRRRFLYVAIALLTGSAAWADEADDTVPKLANKLKVIIEHRDLDRTKPVEKLSITYFKVNKNNLKDLQALVKEIPNLKELKSLSFLGTRIENSVLRKFGGCPSLEYLDLSATLVS